MSRFYESSFDYRGHRLHCPEALYQAIKVDILGNKADLRKLCGYANVDKQRAWKAVRLAHRRDIDICQTLHNDTFRSALLTKDTLLVDDSHDSFWGGSCNTYGKLLMELRADVRVGRSIETPVWFRQRLPCLR